MSDGLSGRKVLVVEDEFVNAIFVSDTLSLAGYEVVGPAGTVEHALALVEEETFDGAILDVNLAGHPIDPVVERLAARGTPMLLATGYESSNLSDRLRRHSRIQKPFGERELLAALQDILAPSSARSSR